MNKDTQKRQIQRILSQQSTKELDVFYIYQLIERCHFEKWHQWALALSAYLPPGSLDDHYSKRTYYLTAECRKAIELNNAGRQTDPNNIIRAIIRDIATKGFPERLEFEISTKYALFLPKEKYAPVEFEFDGCMYTVKLSHSTRQWSMWYALTDWFCHSTGTIKKQTAVLRHHNLMNGSEIELQVIVPSKQYKAS